MPECLSYEPAERIANLCQPRLQAHIVERDRRVQPYFTAPYLALGRKQRAWTQSCISGVHRKSGNSREFRTQTSKSCKNLSSILSSLAKQLEDWTLFFTSQYKWPAKDVSCYKCDVKDYLQSLDRKESLTCISVIPAESPSTVTSIATVRNATIRSSLR